MPKYILWQREHSPTSIVGTLEAENIVEAANIARAMWGSFYVLEWSLCTRMQQQLAQITDIHADTLQRAAL